MKINEYQKLAKKTCANLDNVLLNTNLLHCELGVLTECGEILDIFKKKIAYGKELDIVNVGEEIADVAWYIVNEATFTHRELTELKNRWTPISSDLEFINSVQLLMRHYVSDRPMIALEDRLGLLVNMATYFSLDFEELLGTNIAKLKARFPNNFNSEDALNRDLDNERRILESGTTIGAPTIVNNLY